MILGCPKGRLEFSAWEGGGPWLHSCSQRSFIYAASALKLFLPLLDPKEINIKHFFFFCIFVHTWWYWSLFCWPLWVVKPDSCLPIHKVTFCTAVLLTMIWTTELLVASLSFFPHEEPKWNIHSSVESLKYLNGELCRDVILEYSSKRRLECGTSYLLLLSFVCGMGEAGADGSAGL